MHSKLAQLVFTPDVLHSIKFKNPKEFIVPMGTQSEIDSRRPFDPILGKFDAIRSSETYRPPRFHLIVGLDFNLLSYTKSQSTVKEALSRDFLTYDIQSQNGVFTTVLFGKSLKEQLKAISKFFKLTFYSWLPQRFASSIVHLFDKLGVKLTSQNLFFVNRSGVRINTTSFGFTADNTIVYDCFETVANGLLKGTKIQRVQSTFLFINEDHYKEALKMEWCSRSPIQSFEVTNEWQLLIKWACASPTESHSISVKLFTELSNEAIETRVKYPNIAPLYSLKTIVSKRKLFLKGKRVFVIGETITAVTYYSSIVRELGGKVAESATQSALLLADHERSDFETLSVRLKIAKIEYLVRCLCQLKLLQLERKGSKSK